MSWNETQTLPFVTASQLRAARGLLDLSQKELAEKAGVGVATIRRLETAKGDELPSITMDVYMKLVRCFEQSGVEFTKVERFENNQRRIVTGVLHSVPDPEDDGIPF